MGKTRDLVKKIRYQGIISCKDGHNKGQKWYGPNRSIGKPVRLIILASEFKMSKHSVCLFKEVEHGLNVHFEYHTSLQRKGSRGALPNLCK